MSSALVSTPTVLLRSSALQAERLKMGLELYFSFASFDVPVQLVIRQPALVILEQTVPWLGLSQQAKLLHLLQPDSLRVECDPAAWQSLNLPLSAQCLSSQELESWLQQQSGWISIW